MVAIHQVLPVFSPRDAIGNHTIAVRRALRGMGIDSEIIAGEVNPGAGNGARSVRELEGRRGRRLSGDGHTWLLYHASTGSAVVDWLVDRPEPKLLDYHNITPAELMGPWEQAVGTELEHGRRQLAELAHLTEWAFADSSYNEQELIGLGYRRTAVVPILLDPASFVGNVDGATLARLEERQRADGGVDWLVVSRLLPHKAQHDVIKAFAAYRQAYDRSARLHLVGAIGSSRYADALVDFVDALGLTTAVHFTGSVSAGQLEAYYRAAHVYVALSDHEGFGVPLLEAMAHGLPVVTYACTAVPETVGHGALLLDDKDPVIVAAAVQRVITDDALRTALITTGRSRLDVFSLEASTATLRAAVGRILTEAGVAA
jgi:glycosyltransferase involved in cell wall biosynthesis